MTIGSVNGRAEIGSDLLVKNVSYKDTPVIVTSWSYVTTTITLNVASHTFVAGDYIEVGGLTATTNIPNGVHLVTSVTASTIVYTYALTPTGTAGVSSATVKGYVTTNGRTNGFEGQTRQDVSGIRSIGTLYTNTTGRQIEVNIVYVCATNQGVKLTVGGKDVGTIYNSNPSALIGCASAIVNNNETYIVSLDGGAPTLRNWSELR